MKRKNELPLLFTLAILLASAPAAAHAAQQKDSTPTPQIAQPAQPHVDQDQGNALRTISGPYRLTYTLTEMDGTKRMGSQRYVIVLVADGPHSHLSIDSSVPVLDSNVPMRDGSLTKPTYSREHANVIIDATLRQRANGMELITGVIQTAFAKEAGNEQTTDAAPPVIRDFGFTTTTLLTENKPVTIGQLDVPSTIHRLQVEVELTKLP